MDNNELDKMLKDKLNEKIKPSAEFERKIREKVEEEKKAKLADNNSKECNKVKKYGKIKGIISIAAVALVVCTVGMNLKTIDLPINGEITIASVAKIKSIEPTKLESGILASDSEFIIYAEGENLNKEAVQKSIYIEPALDYTIEETSNSNEYKLKFKQNIPDNTILKLQYVKNQITENSWAYQTSNKLSVTRTYPSNGSDMVSKKSTIEIEFSYASVENLEENVKISPSLDGKWEHLGKIWRFVPSKELKENTTYTVTVNNKVKTEEQSLDDDYIFNFSVSENVMNPYVYDNISMDGINTYKSDEQVKIYYTKYDDTNIKIAKVEISKFQNVEDFIEYVKTKSSEKAVSEGQYEFEEKENYIQLNKSLQDGYYVASIKNSKGNELFNCPIQINDLSAYAIQSERDILVWVANGNDLSKDVNVNYENKEQKTDNNGIAKFEGVADNSETIKYLQIGNNENKLVIGVYNYNLSNYPAAYLYTDRPVYKNTDTINIWGFVPRSLFYDKIEDEFYIEINSEGKQKVEVGEDGNINYKIDLKNHIDSEYGSIVLYYKDSAIANRNVTIENYELQNYEYEVIMDKNYAYSGTKFEFDVKVKHITGLVVPNKSVAIEYEDQIFKETTGEDGVAHFSINVDIEDDFGTQPMNKEIDIFNGDAEEYTTAETYTYIYLLNRHTYTNIEEMDNRKYKVTLYKLAEDKNVEVDYELKEIYDGAYETDVEMNLIETVTQRHIEGYTYNEYTKENEPEYYYTSSENKKAIKTLSTENGVIEVDTNKLEFKEDTEEVSYSYELEFIYKDSKGKKVIEKQYIYFDEEYQQEFGYYYDGVMEIQGSSDELYQVSTNINDRYYYTYRYLFKIENNKFSIGDTVEFTLAESTENGIKDIQNEGKILKIALKEDITETDLITDSKFNYTFTEEDFPGCKITTAYFFNGRFYRMPVYYFDFNEEDRKVDIEILADKEEYEPGEEVTLTVKTTNQGKAVKSFVNISVVNEAVFALEDDTTNLLQQIYLDKNYPVYTYSSFADYINTNSGGGAGGGGDARGEFADTAHFETVYTDKNGIAKITFKLPDNVTTYRVTAQSANEDLYLGVNTLDIVSKLDFFVQSTEPRNVKTSDDLVLNATSVADTKYDVDYEFTIKELNKTLTTTGSTNNIVTVNFGKLPYGTYHAIIRGKNGLQEDAIEYEFKIVESTQEVKNKTTINITDNTTIKPSKNPIVLEIYNKNMSKYLEYIEFVESTLSERLDTQIAYNEIQIIRDKYYGTESTLNHIDIDYYVGSEFLRNLKNGEDDVVLTALTSYYAKQYYTNSLAYGRIERELSEKDNIFEFYLLAAANNESVLTDLLYLKAEKDIDNYSKLLVTLSLEFVGDYQNAKELYNTIDLTDEETEEYKSIVAIIETFINKKEAVSKIDNLIANSPVDEYLRFAILSFFKNNAAEIEQEANVKISSSGLKENVTINGMEVKTFTVYDEDLGNINFETNSNDLMASYYYQTLLDDVDSKDVTKDIKIKIDGELKKGNTVNLVIEFNSKKEGELRIALPNSLRLAQNYEMAEVDSKFYIQNNKIDYITVFKTKKCKKITLPLLVVYEGNYKFENVVSCIDGIYHISNSLNLNIKK